MLQLSFRLKIVAAFLSIYLIWGSTYLAIRFAIQTFPPFFMAATRFLIAGGALYAWTAARGTPKPTRSNWIAATIVGGLLLLGGNGGVVWAERFVPSGLAAVLITTVPLWMALLEWFRNEHIRPTRQVALGLIIGFSGLIFLVGPKQLAGNSEINQLGAAVLILAALSWAIGSLYSRKAKLPSVPLQSTAMEMIAGGILLFGAGVVAQEWVGFSISHMTTISLIALLYLIIFGSMIGFSSYEWLLTKTTSARVSTYAYINPVVAVFLGWALAGEQVTLRTLLAAAGNSRCCGCNHDALEEDKPLAGKNRITVRRELCTAAKLSG